MQSDRDLGNSLANNAAWNKDDVTGKSAKELKRFNIPSLERGKMSFSGEERNHLFLNQNGAGFEDVSPLSGLDDIADSRSFAIWDFDRDGWQDIVLSNINAPTISLHRNECADIKTQNKEPRNFIAFRLIGGNKTSQPTKEFSNRDAIGAKISLFLDDSTLVDEKNCTEGFAAQNSALLHFGLGENAVVPKVKIEWPSGRVTELENIPATKLVTVFEDKADSTDGSEVAIVDYLLPQSFQPSTLPATRKVERFARLGGEHKQTELFVYTSMATWCDNCKRHLRQLQILRDRFSENELELIAIPVDPSDDLTKLENYQSENQPAYQPLEVWDLANIEKFKHLVKENLNFDLFPSTIVTDRDGNVLDVLPNIPTVSDVLSIRSKLKIPNHHPMNGDSK